MAGRRNQNAKLSRPIGQRRALLRGLVNSLVLHESIITTEAKAKAVAPQFERLVTKAKQPDLAGQRMVRQELLTDNAATKLITELAPGWNDRHGGYTRIVKLGTRRGDNASMAIVSLVMPPKKAKTADKPKEVDTAETKTAKKAPAKEAKA
jgi:large subunit ribosomal protein L17